MRQSSRNLDRLEVTFDDPRAVANGGLVLPMTLADRLGLKELVDKNVHLGDAPGHANVGQKAMALVASALVGGDSIDDAGVLRTGRADALLGRWVPAPSTLGTFLRSFSWADARSLDKVAGELLKRAWSAGAGPGEGPLTVDVDSSICRAYGLKKEGVTFGYTKVRGLHPLLATGLGQVLGVRQRGGNAHTARGAASFLAEVFNRVRAAGATGPLSLRGDSGFYNQKVVGTCQKANVRFSITAKVSKSLRGAIDKIPEKAWTAVPYWMEGGADVAETTYRAFGKEPLRLVVRRVKPAPGSQLALFEAYEYHAFITDNRYRLRCAQLVTLKWFRRAVARGPAGARERPGKPLPMASLLRGGASCADPSERGGQALLYSGGAGWPGRWARHGRRSRRALRTTVPGCGRSRRGRARRRWPRNAPTACAPRGLLSGP